MKVYELIRHLRRMPRDKDVKLYGTVGCFDDNVVSEVVEVVDENNPNKILHVGLFTAKMYSVCMNNGEG